MWWAVLGTVEVQVGGRTVELGGAKQRRVLTALLVDAGSVVPVSRLVDSVWGDDPPPSAVSTLRSYVAHLRRALEPDRPPREAGKVLVSVEAGYRLRVLPEQYDAARFGALAEAGRLRLAGGRPLDALAELDRALALWRGPAYGEFGAEPFAALEADRLEELRLTAQEWRCGAQLAAGRPESAAAELRSLVAAEPLRERRWELLALALYRSDRQADALTALRDARRMLDEHLGVEPGRPLRRLEQAILHQDAELDLAPGLTPDAAPERAPVAPLAAPGAPRGAAPPVPEAAVGGPALAGRREVLAGVERALAALADGRGGLLTVTGEPGIGKTRIAEAAVERAGAAGITAAVGRCPDGEGVPALWPWLEVLRAVAPGRAPDAAGPGDGGRSGAPAMMVERLVRVARTRPLLVVLEDLHWADPDSVSVLRVLATMVPELPLLVLVTSREGPELDDSAASVVGGLTGDWVTRHPLARLTEAEVAQMLGAHTGPGADPRLASVVHRRCGGVPFHVAELAKLLPQSGAGAGAGAEALARALPEGTRDLIRHRLRRLPEGAEDALRVAAVLGERFGLDVVAEAAGTEPDRLLDILEAAVAWGLVVETGPVGHYRFGHALIRDTLRHSLSRIRRARLHARVAAALERRAARSAGGGAELLDAVAFHWLAAAPVGHAGRALVAVTAAAERAERVYAHRHAARLVEAAIGVVDTYAAPTTTEETRRLFELVLRWGRLCCRGALRPESVRALDRAIGIARELADPEALARAATVHTIETFTPIREYGSSHDTVLTALRDAVRLLPREDAPLRCLALAALAAERYFAGAGEPDGAPGSPGADGLVAKARLSAEAVEMARRLGDDSLLLRALHLRHQAVRHPDTLAERQRLVEEQLVLAGRPGVSPDWMPMLLLRRALTRLEAGDMPAAQRDIDDCAAANQRVRLPEIDAHLRWWAALRHGLAGDLPAAERLAGQAYRHHQQAAWGAEPALFAHRVSWLLDGDRYDEMEALVLASHRPGTPITPEHLGLVLALQGRLAEAGTYCPPAEALPEPPHDWLWLLQMVLRAYTWALCGDVRSCRWALDRLLPYAGRAVTTGSAMLCWGSIDHFLAEVAEVAGERTAAATLMRGAVRHNGELGCVRWAQRSRRRLAELTAAP
ncbi:BTAD domain-containing putative transcriptional regulator [Streptomyces sp. NPDC059142]|uniref:BTAD domain-containing putative transcriptional regulator n=1 Tax=Streptomyces sp. NPDC059142 TaxID=3346739 RepID=UPI0036958B9B